MSEKEDRKFGMKKETRENLKLRFSLIKMTLLTLILYATYTSAYPLAELIIESGLNPKMIIWLNNMIPIILISITAIATAFLAPIKVVREKIDSAPSPASQTRPMPAAPAPPAPASTP
jgi:hypothetical protein